MIEIFWSPENGLNSISLGLIYVKSIEKNKIIARSHRLKVRKVVSHGFKLKNGSS